MGFANGYIEKHAIFPKLISQSPEYNLNIIVVIPCLNEPDILNTIDSIQNCSDTQFPIEVIVHINSGEGENQEIIDQNIETEKILFEYFSLISVSNKRFYVIHNKDLPQKHAGAGLARKIGMDEAIQRFNTIDNPNGIIVSLDADTLCGSNFLVEIENQYLKTPKTKGSLVYFEHPTDGKELSKENYQAIIKYELYLRYYRQSLKYTGYPFAFHTIGSIFNVKASVYSAQGGMNRKQAGEDFYFLQKVFPLGDFYEINSTTVYPSSRISNRVPFGTGPMMKQIIEGKGNLKTYSFKAFSELKELFDKTDSLFTSEPQLIIETLATQQPTIYNFAIENKFVDSVKEIKENSASLNNFRIRFFKWFNAFLILKYLNFAHNEVYMQTPIEEVAQIFLTKVKGIETKSLSTLELLILFRNIEKNIE